MFPDIKKRSKNFSGRTYIRNTSQDIYKSRDKYVYSHSGTTLSKMLECLVNFIAKCKLSDLQSDFVTAKKCM